MCLDREPSHDISLKKPTGPSFGACSGLPLCEDGRLPKRTRCSILVSPIESHSDLKGRLRGRRGGSGGDAQTEHQLREAGEPCERIGINSMDLEYLFNQRTDGANPSKIWSFIQSASDERIAWYISRMTYQQFLRTAYWFAVASKRKSDLGMRCQVCNESGQLNVHHRTYDTHGAEHLNLNDLCVLCEFCHGLFHGHLPAAPHRFRASHVERVKKRTVIPHTEADLAIPESETITLTKELIDACRANGSFTNATMRAFGLTKATIQKGWTFRLIGKQMSRDEYKAAQEGKFHYNTGRLL